nr:MAG: major capsid protein [Microviridae sp.]
MAQSVFDATLDVNNQIKVNTFDWSHSNNLTTQIGRITPIFCELVPNKGSIRINPRFGLQLMPMVFPVQTPMRARIAFFKYPLRALWKGYRDFVGNFRQGLEEPYIDFNSASALKAMASTGSLGDYLGLPTTLFGSYGTSESVSSTTTVSKVAGNQFNGSPTMVYLTGIPVNSPSQVVAYKSHSPEESSTTHFGFTLSNPATAGSTEKQSVMNFVAGTLDFSEVPASNETRIYFDITLNFTGSLSTDIMQAFADNIYAYTENAGESGVIYNFPLLAVSQLGDSKVVRLTYGCSPELINLNPQNCSIRFAFNYFNALGRRISGNTTAWGIQYTTLAKFLFVGATDGDQSDTIAKYTTNISKVAITRSLVSDTPSDLTLETSPYYNSNSNNKDNQIKVSAYAFRAYEGIYNAYYRDNRNNPYYINGEVQYNQWIPSYEGGADQNNYALHYANWEKDFLTTAVQSPQQGTAPLVGITTYTETVSDEATGVTSEISRVALVDEEGKRYQVAFDSDKDGLQGVKYVELDNDVKLRQPRNLIDIATSGISINDLRNVNAYQKFLELNMRKGYSYRDIIEGRFDVKVRYDELLMPEFFGGFSRDIDMHSITQTVDQQTGDDNSYKNALGSQAGVAGVRGDSNNAIECFCDEESIIMGLLIVTPMPVYTQLLPKHFTYRGLLDHYQPEFNHIGFQPILYKEVCPIQAYNENSKSLGETFGYNRPWYEYVQKYDVAHGLFRTDLSNFLMHRVFNEKPQLAQSFLLIDPEQVTDVFSVTETTDKVYGQIYFDCTAKLPISRVAIPRLD